MKTETIHARALALPAAALTAPEWLHYMPAGKQTISAARDGQPATIELTVNAAAAAALQADLVRLIGAGGPPPFFGFDHVDGRASAWPQEFAWRADGIWARLTWTPDGEAAVTVKAAGQLPAYRYFSPSFLINRQTGLITGLCPSEAGSLVNNPAFRALARVTANNLPAPAADNPKNNTMKHEAIAAAAITAGLLTPEEAAGETAGTLTTQRLQALQADASIKASQATELATVTARAVAAETALAAQRETAAESAIQDAVKAGQIAPQDKDTQAFWKASLLSNGDAAVKALATLAKILPARSPAVTPGAAASADGEESDATRARSAAVRAKAIEIQKGEPGLVFSMAYERADRLTPAAA